MRCANGCVQIAEHRMDGWEQDFARAERKTPSALALGDLGARLCDRLEAAGKKILKKSASLRPDDQIEVQLREGKVYAQVQRTEI